MKSMCVSFQGFFVSGIWHAQLSVSSGDQINSEFGADVKKPQVAFSRSTLKLCIVSKEYQQPSIPLRSSLDVEASEEGAAIIYK